jgi:predicted dehydrogenase
MKKLNIGVIGLSRRSAIINGLPEKKAQVTAVADLNPETFSKFGDAVFKTTDYHELLAKKDIDAVFVMTRDYQHEDIGIDALNSGKAVFLEKPMGISIEGCDRLLETAYQTKTKFFMGHNMRYFSVVLKMKEIIDSGIIGDIQAVWCRHFIGYGSCYFRHWCSEQKNSTGLLLQKGAHDIDVIHWLSGSYTKQVIGMGKLSVYSNCERRGKDEEPDREIAFKDSCWPPLENKGLSPVIDIEAHNMVMMSLNNGVHVSYNQCFYTPDSERNYTFIGTKGRLENIGDTGDCEVHVWTNRGSRCAPDIKHYLKGSAAGHGGSDPKMLDAFVEYVLNNTLPNTSPVAARNAVATGIAGHESMRNGSIPKDVPQVPQHIEDYFKTQTKT